MTYDSIDTPNVVGYFDYDGVIVPSIPVEGSARPPFELTPINDLEAYPKASIDMLAALSVSGLEVVFCSDRTKDEMQEFFDKEPLFADFRQLVLPKQQSHHGRIYDKIQAIFDDQAIRGPQHIVIVDTELDKDVRDYVDLTFRNTQRLVPINQFVGLDTVSMRGIRKFVREYAEIDPTPLG